MGRERGKKKEGTDEGAAADVSGCSEGNYCSGVYVVMVR